ncbi:GNAT family N-acetyltransferase [Tautonia rosea]|uniref:GNAT family N-acetyltransferase n=1 Tax=Tautonia rosea TaxID=2728037 RepID=UPI001474BAFC|nr:hypothetical protein [Tautonia rosea]
MRLPRSPVVSWGRSSKDLLFGPLDPPETRSEFLTHKRPGFEFRLRDGRLVFLTPVLPEDRLRLEAAFEQLSDQSRVFRFFRQRDRLSEEEIRQFIQVDQVDHVAWCALDLPDPPFDGLGSGRLIRDASDPETAEVAVTVIDAAQGYGLGTVLLAVLVLRARMLGISRMKAYVLPANTVVVQWLKSLGWSTVRDEDSLEFEFSTISDPIQAPQSPSRQRFEQLLLELQRPFTDSLNSLANPRSSDSPTPVSGDLEGHVPAPETDEAS